jgi:hypothetical protein
MRNARFRWVVCCTFVIAAAGCQTPSQDWNGTWKLNPTKSSYQGQILTISISPDGEYRFDENSSNTLRCDGKDQPLGNNRTLLCVKSVGVLDITLKENGAKTRTTHDALSADGKFFTTTVTEFRPKGPIITSQLVFSRLSGANDFAGQWRDTNYLQQHVDMILRLDDQALHINYPSAGQYVDAPLNGAEAALRGSHVLEGATLAARPAGNREFLFETKRNGKVFTQGSLKLSDDGRVITHTWWNPERPANKGAFVYEKE